MNTIRKGDTIFGAHGGIYYVTKSDHDRCKARPIKEKSLKTFRIDSLECIDQDDGIWQEMIP